MVPSANMNMKENDIDLKNRVFDNSVEDNVVSLNITSDSSSNLGEKYPELNGKLIANKLMSSFLSLKKFLPYRSSFVLNDKDKDEEAKINSSFFEVLSKEKFMRYKFFKFSMILSGFLSLLLVFIVSLVLMLDGVLSTLFLMGLLPIGVLLFFAFGKLESFVANYHYRDNLANCGKSYYFMKSLGIDLSLPRDKIDGKLDIYIVWLEKLLDDYKNELNNLGRELDIRDFETRLDKTSDWETYVKFARMVSNLSTNLDSLIYFRTGERYGVFLGSELFILNCVNQSLFDLFDSYEIGTDFEFNKDLFVSLREDYLKNNPLDMDCILKRSLSKMEKELSEKDAIEEKREKLIKDSVEALFK